MEFGNFMKTLLIIGLIMVKDKISITDRQAFIEWKKIIQKMIDAFELYISTSQDNFSIEEFKKENNIIKEGFELFGKYINNLWW